MESQIVGQLTGLRHQRPLDEQQKFSRRDEHGHEPNGTTLHATSDGFTAPPYDRLRGKREKLYPFVNEPHVEDWNGYQKLGEVSASKLDALIDLLTVECITAHLQ